MVKAMEQFERAGLTFDISDGGPADGEAVVLLHGFPQDHTAWSGVAPLLNDAGLRTLAPDQRGYSPGARPTARRAYTGDELVDDIVALLDAAGVESAHVVGHDWGGAVAWGIAAHHPERVRSVTVLSTPHPLAFTGSMIRSSQLLRSWYMLAFQLPRIPEWFIGNHRLADGLQRAGLPADHAAHYAKRMGERGAPRGAINWYRGLPFTLAGRKVEEITVPTTYVWGRGDSYLGRAGAEATAAHVTGPYRFVELDAAHWLPETHAADVAAAITEQVAATKAPSA